MNGGIQLTFKEFIELHYSQLISSGIPELFWQTLHEKLLHEVN